jgi:hypothetical protein
VTIGSLASLHEARQDERGRSYFGMRSAPLEGLLQNLNRSTMVHRANGAKVDQLISPVALCPIRPGQLFTGFGRLYPGSPKIYTARSAY